MTIGAGKSAGRLATTRHSASMPPAEEPITTSCASAAFVGTLFILRPTCPRVSSRCQRSAGFPSSRQPGRGSTFAATRVTGHEISSRVAARQATLGPTRRVAPTLAADRRRTTRPPSGRSSLFPFDPLPDSPIDDQKALGLVPRVKCVISSSRPNGVRRDYPFRRTGVGRPSALSLSGSWCLHLTCKPLAPEHDRPEREGLHFARIAPEGHGIPHCGRVPAMDPPESAGGVAR